jgi:hypothetical protein
LFLLLLQLLQVLLFLFLRQLLLVLLFLFYFSGGNHDSRLAIVRASLKPSQAGGLSCRKVEPVEK